MDSSVWIDHLRGVETPRVVKLQSRIAADRSSVLVGDLVLAEVLQGLRSEKAAQVVEAAMRESRVVEMVTAAIAVQAAAHYRLLRSRGISVRSTIDMLIATYCIANDLELLHSDRDFPPMQQHLGLRIVA